MDSITQAGNVIAYTAPFNFIGRDTVTYRLTNAVTSLCNESNAADTAYLIIIVLNRPPVAVDDVETTNPCQPIVIDVLGNDTDPENGSILIHAVSAVSPPTAGTATTDGNLIYFTPNAAYVGASASFTYTIEDDATPPAISNAATVTINFNNIPNDPPVAVNDSVYGLYNSDTYINVLDNDSDPDGDPLTVSLTPGLLQPAHGTITLLPNGLIVYTPALNFYGTDVFEYRLSDSHFGPGGGGSCTSVAQDSIARVYIIITDFFIVLDKNDVRLSGYRQANQNLLLWSVPENNMPYTYIIEKSNDNRNFKTIATSIQNNPTGQLKNYQWTDKDIADAIVYYRIKIVKNNDPLIYSNTIQLKSNQTKASLKAYPIPFSDQLTTSIFANSSDKMTLTLINAIGIVVYQKEFLPQKGINQIKMENLAQLTDGFYILSLKQNNLDFRQNIIKIK